MEHQTGCKSMQEKGVRHSALGYLGQAPTCTGSKERHFVHLRLKISFKQENQDGSFCLAAEGFILPLSAAPDDWTTLI